MFEDRGKKDNFIHRFLANDSTRFTKNRASRKGRDIVHAATSGKSNTIKEEKEQQQQNETKTKKRYIKMRKTENREKIGGEAGQIVC